MHSRMVTTEQYHRIHDANMMLVNRSTIHSQLSYLEGTIEAIKETMAFEQRTYDEEYRNKGNQSWESVYWIVKTNTHNRMMDRYRYELRVMEHQKQELSRMLGRNGQFHR